MLFQHNIQPVVYIYRTPDLYMFFAHYIYNLIHCKFRHNCISIKMCFVLTNARSRYITIKNSIKSIILFVSILWNRTNPVSVWHWKAIPNISYYLSLYTALRLGLQDTKEFIQCIYSKLASWNLKICMLKIFAYCLPIYPSNDIYYSVSKISAVVLIALHLSHSTAWLLEKVEPCTKIILPVLSFDFCTSLHVLHGC